MKKHTNFRLPFRMPKFLALTLALCLVVSLLPMTVFATQFTDTQGNWAEQTIDKWTNMGLLQGDGNGLFRPNDPVKKDEMATILNSLMNYVQTSSTNYADVQSDAWYADTMQKLIAAGVVTPDANGNINPEAQLSRADMMTMMAVAFNLAPVSGATDFTDDSSISAAERPYIKALEEKGYVKGYPVDGGFELLPNKNLSRAEMLTFVDNTVGSLASDPGVYDTDVNGNMIVNVAGVTLQNMTINGDLYLAEGIDLGSVTLDNVKVTGTIYVKAGDGVNGISISNSSAAGITGASVSGTTLINLDNSQIGTLDMQKGGTVNSTNGSTVALVNVPASAPEANQTVTLNGSFGDLAVNSYNSLYGTNGTDAVALVLNASVDTATLDAATKITGTGSIASLGGTAVADSTVASGVTVSAVAPTPTAAPTASTSSGSGSSGSSNSGSSSTLVPISLINSYTSCEQLQGSDLWFIVIEKNPYVTENPNTLNVALSDGSTVIAQKVTTPAGVVQYRAYQESSSANLTIVSIVKGAN